MGNSCFSPDNVVIKSIDHVWINYNITSTNCFTLNDKYTICRVVDIYDGDTCTIIIPLFDKYYKFIVRLAEIDTCELTSKSSVNKELAYKARMRLFNFVTNKNLDLYVSRKKMKDELNDNIYLIHILCGEFDKYGRLLGWLFPLKYITTPTMNDISIKSFNHKLINDGYASYYNGGTKLTEDEQLQHFELSNS